MLDQFLFIFSIAVSTILLVAQLARKKITELVVFSFSKWAFIFSSLSVFFCYIFLTGAQYFLWIESGPPSSFFIPPHRGIEYLLQYHATRFLMYYAVSFIVAIFIIFLGNVYDRKHGYVFFEKGELFIAGTGVLLLGNHSWGYSWIFYLIVAFCVGIAGTFFINRVLKKPDERFSLYYVWMPLAIAVIIIGELVISN